MVRSAALALAFVLAVTPALADPTTTDPAKAPAGTYELDPRHASLLVRVSHMGGFSRYTMRFDRLSGGFAYDPANWQAARPVIRVDPRSINTGIPAFDKTIAETYFGAARHPAIVFTTTAIEAGEGAKGKVTGDLAFHGVTKPVTLDVTFNGAGPGLLGAGTRMGFSGTARIRRSDFGVTNMAAMAGDELELMFEVEFVRK